MLPYRSIARALAAGLVAIGATACSSGTLPLGPRDGSVDGVADAGPDPCAEAGVPASTLACTGLYADFDGKVVAASAVPYAPATPLWADGAEKSRWIALPPGGVIDATDRNEWTLPIGTKVWKEFRIGGKRVETRLFQKTQANFWVRATYLWSGDDSSAPIFFGGSVPVADAGSWHVPTPDECDQCHRGRTDRVLGFEEVGLGLAGATGLTLAELAARGWIRPAPANVHLAIGDDGTGLDGPALAWLHVNCGVTCHSANEDAVGYGAGMLLRLDPSVLDGRPAVGWDPLRTTIGVNATSGAVAGRPRILPGSPSGSVIVQLIGQRGALQMPPLASKVVDAADVAAVSAWIARMPAPDGGVVAAPADAGSTDAGGSLDAQILDADGSADAAQDANDSSEDAGAADASAHDAGEDGSTEDARVDAEGPG